MKCFVPCSPWRLGEAETWLNEQAREGRVLQKWGQWLVTFAKEKQLGLRYRLDADDGRSEPNPDRKRKNEAAGWEYVTSLPAVCVHVYRTESPEAVMEEDESLREAAAKQYRLTVLLEGFTLVCLLAVLYWLLSRQKWWLLEFMQQNRWEILGAFVLYLFLGVRFAREIFLKARLSWILKRRPELIHAGKYLRGAKAYGMVGIAETAAIILLWGMLVFGRNDHYENLSDLKDTVSYVDLAELEGEGFEFSMIKWRDDPDVNAANEIRRAFIPLAREYYEINQSGWHEGAAGSQDIEEGAGKEDVSLAAEAGYASLEGKYWCISSDFIAGRLFGQLVERYTKYGWYYSLFRGYEELESDTWLIRSVPDSRFVELVTASGTGEDYRGEMTLVFARTEDRVIYLEYTGKADAERLIEALGEAFGL